MNPKLKLLAQAEALENYRDDCCHSDSDHFRWLSLRAKRLRAQASALVEKQEEAVAWMYTYKIRGVPHSQFERRSTRPDERAGWEPLYTSPPSIPQEVVEASEIEDAKHALQRLTGIAMMMTQGEGDQDAVTRWSGKINALLSKLGG